MKGLVHIYEGTGKGKSTAGVGLTIRCAGNGFPVVYSQFLKDGTTGEMNILRKIPNITVLVEEHHFELVDVEFVKEAGTWFLRAYIDKPGGITIDDCELISRALSDQLDKDDFIEEAYILEVSSPGLGRPLKKDKDLERSLGESVDVRLFRAIDRQKEFTGILKAWDKETVTLEFEDEAELVIERANIALIRLAFDF